MSTNLDHILKVANFFFKSLSLRKHFHFTLGYFPNPILAHSAQFLPSHTNCKLWEVFKAIITAKLKCFLVIGRVIGELLGVVLFLNAL